MAIFSGDIFAEQYVISSSVTNVTIGSVSGSTAFGDTSDDTHQFTGSIDSTGAIRTDSLVQVDGIDGLWFNGGGSSTFSPSPYIGYISSPTGTGCCSSQRAPVYEWLYSTYPGWAFITSISTPYYIA